MLNGLSHPGTPAKPFLRISKKSTISINSDKHIKNINKCDTIHNRRKPVSKDSKKSSDKIQQAFIKTLNNLDAEGT